MRRWLARIRQWLIWRLGGTKEVCQFCARTERHSGWSTSNELWRGVMGNHGGFCCLGCFEDRAFAAGVIPSIRVVAVISRPCPDCGSDYIVNGWHGDRGSCMPCLISRAS